MMEKDKPIEKKIWLTGVGCTNRISGGELFYNISLQNIMFNVNIIPELNQTHIHMDTEDLRMLRDAIDKKLE